MPEKGRAPRGTYYDRGLHRVLVSDASEEVKRLALAWTSASTPPTLTRNAAESVERTSKLFELRGFVGVKTADLLNSERWSLEWVDVKYTYSGVELHGAAFTTRTSTGGWRLLLQPPGSPGGAARVSGAWPVGGPPLATPSEDTLRQEQLGARKKLPDEERWRLQEWSKKLQKADVADGDSLWCLWEDCVDDPDLKSALDKWPQENWKQWQDRAARAVEQAKSEQLLTVPVEDVLFTQSSINSAFREEQADIDTLVRELLRGRANPLTDQKLALRAVRYRGRLHSLDNRRLWALQQYQLLIPMDLAVYIKVRLLPWSDFKALKEFCDKFTSDNAGEAVHVRVDHRATVPVPTPGVALSTLKLAVLTTNVARQHANEALLTRLGNQLEQDQGTGSTLADTADSETAVCLAGVRFDKLSDAKAWVQERMLTYIDGRRISDREQQVLQALFAYHPDSEKCKRAAAAAYITVGTSEEHPDSPAFWIWRHDGKSEDISTIKCFKVLDLQIKHRKARALYLAKSTAVAEGQRFAGRLDSWNGEYGFIQRNGQDQKLYVQKIQFEEKLQPLLTGLSWKQVPEVDFELRRWNDTGKVFCCNVCQVNSW